ncbi:methyltransferase/methylase [Sphingomonas sp. DBB INV C78]|uniref:methyltransferase n=1 Tax=Sphingomonas sp. DBB INV C78 TaxID=3349434 RepID=UPI0036D37F7B
MSNPLDPARILQTGAAFWPSKVLLTAVEFGLFTQLGQQAMTGAEVEKAIGLHPRGTFDFLDTLVALGFLERDGDGPDGRYRNTPETAAFLDKASDKYLGGALEMLNARLFGYWNALGTALRTGRPQNEVRDGGQPLFAALYADQARLEQFLEAMSGFQGANFAALAEKFDFSRYQTVCDVGGALALLSRTLARRHPHLRFQSFDLPVVAPLAQKQVDQAGLSDRIAVVAGDFLQGDLPKADVITLGNILHDWNLEGKKLLIGKAYAALPPGGALIAIENVIDDARRTNAFGLMMSLNMLIEFGDAFDYTGADFRSWCAEAGFTRFEIMPLAGPASAAIAWK